MINYVAVLPYAYKPYFEECLATLKLPLDNVLFIDNTVDNAGVAESWNQGIDFMRERGADWLIIISAAIRFGEAGGLDMIEQLAKNPDAQLVHFATEDIEEQPFVRGNSPSYDDGLLGWHLTAIREDVIDKVGFFDPNFYPIYFEDIDYDLRLNKAYTKPVCLILPVEAEGSTIAHGVALGGVKAPAEPNLLYFCSKWGRMPDAQQLGEYATPFNDPTKTMAFFPPANGRQWDE